MIKGLSLSKKELERICEECKFKCEHYRTSGASFSAIRNRKIRIGIIERSSYEELYQYCFHYNDIERLKKEIIP